MSSFTDLYDDLMHSILSIQKSNTSSKPTCCLYAPTCPRSRFLPYLCTAWRPPPGRYHTWPAGTLGGPVPLQASRSWLPIMDRASSTKRVTNLIPHSLYLEHESTPKIPYIFFPTPIECAQYEHVKTVRVFAYNSRLSGTGTWLDDD